MFELFTRARVYMTDWADKNPGFTADDFNSMFLDYEEDLRIFNFSQAKQFTANGQKYKNIKSVNRQTLEAAFFEYLKKLPLKHRLELKEQIKCTKENLEPLKQWVKAVTGTVNDDDLYVMAHWIWLVKRNAHHLPVVWHIMPIVTSPKQGGGKSTAVKMLIAPLEKLTTELQIPQIVDERNFTVFTNNLIGFFDEMAGAEKVEMATFKRNVTSSNLSYRPMRTNTQAKIINYCSFIGATNNNLFEFIKDTTGVRRFFPINAVDELDHKLLATIDFMTLWRGVDENLERGYFEQVRARVAIKQETLTMKDEVAVFLEDYDIMPTDDKSTTINGKRLYEEYVVHCQNSGSFKVSRQLFYKRLQAAGLKWTKKADSNKVLTYYFCVNPKVAIPNQGSNGLN